MEANLVNWEKKNLIDIQKMFQFKIHEYLFADWTEMGTANFFLSLFFCLLSLRVVLVCLFETKKKIIINDEDERLWREMGFCGIIMQKSY